MEKEKMNDETEDEYLNIFADLINEDCDLLFTDKNIYARVMKYIGPEPFDFDIVKLMSEEDDTMKLRLKDIEITWRKNYILIKLSAKEDYSEIAELLINRCEGEPLQIKDDIKSIPVMPHPNRAEAKASWKCIEKKNTAGAYLYDKPLEKILELYKDGKEPNIEEIEDVLREMYSPQNLQRITVNKYAYAYRRYINKNVLTPSHKNWKVVGKQNAVYIYDKVLEALLPLFSNENGKLFPQPATEPIKIEQIIEIIQQLYDNNLKKSTLKNYASMYRRYIFLNYIDPAIKKGLAETAKTEEESKEVRTKNKEPPLNSIFQRDDTKELKEIWNLLPDEFTYKDVKLLMPPNTKRVNATNHTINKFLTMPVFTCEEYKPGMFRKNTH